jgi:Iron-containing redox enzyme
VGVEGAAGRGGYRSSVTALPKPRGPLSEQVLAGLTDLPSATGKRLSVEPESDDDAAVALWALHELSYSGFDEVDDAAERDPELFRVRCRLEDRLERRLRERWPGAPGDTDLRTGFFDWVDAHDGPSLARYVQTGASEEQVLDLLRVRSVYHLKEADPTSWVIPRLGPVPKAALVELQYDEYGVGDPARVHAALFARGMEASGLRPEYGAYVNETPVEMLEQNNALSMFGLQRRLRGAAVGHLAAFEATSSLPSRRMAQGLQRLGFPAEMIAYYTEHVEADAVHEQVALRDICVRLVEEEPSLEPDVWFGAWACLDLESRAARRLLSLWEMAA